MSPPEIRLQLAAITLAEELNFRRAADRLKITQPALSKQIAELENRIGFLVFKRNQKRVELTEAGQVFVRGCNDTLAILEKSVLLARFGRTSPTDTLLLGSSIKQNHFSHDERSDRREKLRPRMVILI